MDLQLKDKTAVITGASGGLGRGIVVELASEQMSLMLVGRNLATLENIAQLARQEGSPLVAVQSCDLTRQGVAEATVQAAVTALGGIDLLVNCAGATKRGDFFSLDDRDFFSGFELKFHGTVRMCRAAWGDLKSRRGTVVNITGVGANTPSPDFTIGGPVNAALINFTKALSEIGLRDGVRVNALSPGYIRTERLERRIRDLSMQTGRSLAEAEAQLLDGLRVHRFGEPAEVGRLVAFLASKQATYIHGTTINIDGGVTKGI
ncbi:MULTISPECIES: SDR family oxidoreductase [Xanthobacter]|uniref:SDR family oxidoreductase n=1 Tax=Xanthobacter TaxID=279 RepID=UPI003729D13A